MFCKKFIIVVTKYGEKYFYGAKKFLRFFSFPDFHEKNPGNLIKLPAYCII